MVKHRHRIVTCREHHASLAQLVGGIALRRRAVSVRIRGGAPNRPCSPTVGDAALKARTVFVRIEPRAPILWVWRTVTRLHLKRGFQLGSTPDTHTNAPFAKRQRHLAYTQTILGSSPRGSTMQASPNGEGRGR